MIDRYEFIDPVITATDDVFLVETPAIEDVLSGAPALPAHQAHYAEMPGFLGSYDEASGEYKGVILGSDERTVYRLDGTVLTVLQDGTANLEQLLAML